MKLLFVLILLLISIGLVYLKTYNNHFIVQSTLPEVEDRYIDKPIPWSSDISPDGLHQINSFTYDYADRDNYYKIFITNLETGQIKNIYSGDFHTMGGKWINNNSIKISYDCGTGCLATKVIDINENVAITQEIISENNNWEIKSF